MGRDESGRWNEGVGCECASDLDVSGCCEWWQDCMKGCVGPKDTLNWRWIP